MTCAACAAFAGCFFVLFCFFTAGGGIKHLYLQPGHPKYLLNKLSEEISVYIHVCVIVSLLRLSMYWLRELDMHHTRQYR